MSKNDAIIHISRTKNPQLMAIVTIVPDDHGTYKVTKRLHNETKEDVVATGLSLETAETLSIKIANKFK